MKVVADSDNFPRAVNYRDSMVVLFFENTKTRANRKKTGEFLENRNKRYLECQLRFSLYCYHPSKKECV